MKKVLLLYGGNSSEHDVSIMSANSIINNIDTNNFDITPVLISKENEWFLSSKNNLKKKIKRIDNIIDYVKQFDIVFPITHGNNGEDGKLQGMLDLFNVNYVGSSCLASACGMDKEISKILFNSINIKQVPYITINKNYNLNDIKKKIAYPVIIKPANGGSSIGISKANNDKELLKAIKEALKYDSKVIIEKFIKTRELEVAVMEDKDQLIISNIGEIISCNSFYDFRAKYKKKSELIIPANIDANIINQIKETTKKIFYKFNLKDYSRIDFFLEDNNLYINEINTIPGFTEISMFPKLIMNMGYKYSDIISILLNNNIEKK